jgi:hypothetical protein
MKKTICAALGFMGVAGRTLTHSGSRALEFAAMRNTNFDRHREQSAPGAGGDRRE